MQKIAVNRRRKHMGTVLAHYLPQNGNFAPVPPE